MAKEASEHLRKGRFGKAVELYRAALSSEPDDAQLRARLGDAYRGEKNFERAFHHYKRAATVFANNGNVPMALKVLNDANAVAPNEPDILYRIAEYCQKLGHTAELDGALVQLVRSATSMGDRRRVWALDLLVQLHPHDLNVVEHRAEALSETGRLDEAVQSFKMIAANVGPRDPNFPRVLVRAGAIAVDRPDLGSDVARTLLTNGFAREALTVLVPFYEKHPDHIPVLETLLGAIEAIGAREKILPARIELLKARATKGQHDETMHDVEVLLELGGGDIGVIEVCAHACSAIGERVRAGQLWRHLAMIANNHGMRLERDRAILALLKTNPDDEDALELGANALTEAGRTDEAQSLLQRLDEVRAMKARAVPMQSAPALTGSAPALTEIEIDEDFDATSGEYPNASTMILSDFDVLEVEDEQSLMISNVKSKDGIPQIPTPWGPQRQARRNSEPRLETLRSSDFEEVTNTGRVELVEQQATAAGPLPRAPFKSKTGSAPIDWRAFADQGTQIGHGDDDVTTIAPNTTPIAEPRDEQTLPPDVSAYARQKTLRPIDPDPPEDTERPRAKSAPSLEERLFSTTRGPSSPGLIDPFFSEQMDAEGPPDEVTSRMEAVVEREALRRVGSSIGTSRALPSVDSAPSTQPSHQAIDDLVADLVDD